MKKPSIFIKHFIKLLEKIHSKDNEELILQVSELIKPHSDAIAQKFYNIMLGNAQAAHFLNHDMVKKRLKFTLTAWINSTFLYKNDINIINEHILYQLKIGHIHSKIDLPIGLVNYGMFIIKNEVMQLLQQSTLNREDLARAIMFSSQILDISLSIINESYQGDFVINEKDSESFKLHFSTHNLAFDCERLRATLSNWMRELLLNIQRNEKFDIANSSTIRHSNFGLWVVHKAKLFLDGYEYEQLVQSLDSIDELMISLSMEFDQPEKWNTKLILLDQTVSKTMWLLEDIAREIIDRDSGRDPLTRLFTRRYLNTVLRHETECSLKKDLIFGIVMIDIDHFKKINDTYGHDCGDKVLSQLAGVLTTQIRAGDFVFRFGGEEFLIVLSDINQQVLGTIGEKMRAEVENTKFIIDTEQNIDVTISVGVAMHDRHPDFQRTLKLADDALLKAKSSGRNCVVVEKQPTMTYDLLNKMEIKP